MSNNAHRKLSKKKRWTTEEYETNVRRRNLTPVTREMHNGVRILISDGFQKGATPLFPHGAHYQTEWCIATTEHTVDIAQPMFYQHLLDPNGVAACQHIRVKEAIAAAKTFIESCENKRDYVKG